MWNGENLTEVQAVCPQVEIPAFGSTLVFPGSTGPTDLHVSEVIMRDVGQNRWTKLSADVFEGLYMPQ